MSALGDFLERFYSPEEYFQSIHARVRHTTIESAASSSTSVRPVIGRRRRDASSPRALIEDLAFWVQLPSKVRVETTREIEGHSKTTVEIVNGETSSPRQADEPAEKSSRRSKRSRDINSLPTQFQRHFDRGLLRQCFAALTLEHTGHCEVAGRNCLTIRARQVPGTQLWPHWLSFAANEFEFAGDPEHAVILSIKAIVDQTIVEIHEVLEVTFDVQIDDSCFTDESSAHEKTKPITERLTLEAAATRVPFVVLHPTSIPASNQPPMDTIHRTIMPDGKMHLTTMIYGGADTLWIDQRSERDAGLRDELEWDELLVDGQRMEISDPHPEEGLLVLCCEREKTAVAIVSDLPKDELIKMALSLTPVSNASS